jgi:hypothetical protein
VPAVKIPAQRSGWLGFELSDLIAVIGPRTDLEWQVLDAKFAFGDQATSDTWQAVAYDSRLDGGVDLTWERMEALAGADGKIVQGTFTGFDGNEAIVQLTAFDVRHWIVWARRQSVLDRLRDAFAGVEDCDVRVPHR